MKHICVIGGSGFIGGYVVRRLLATGRKVTVVGRKNISPFGDEVTYLYKADNRPDRLLSELKDIEEVIDLSYSTTPKTSFENPVQDIIENLQVTVELLEQLIKSNIKKLIYVSSGGTVYGQAASTPITEDHRTYPLSPYGITKLAIEKYCQMYHGIHKLPVTIVRPANAYGEGQIAFRGQGFIATAIATIIKGEDIKIYGAEGTIRDYIHADDIAAGIISALDHGEPGECYNIGSGIGRSNIEVVRALESILGASGYKCNYQYLPHRPFDVNTNILDSSKLKSVSGWEPAVDFNTGLSKTIQWYLSNKENA
jgi:UDP-glucose 4-epimerase